MITCKCDGCDNEAPAAFNGKNWDKPTGWYQRDVAVLRHNYGGVDEAGQFTAPTVVLICSLPCAALVAEKFKKYLTL